MMFFEDVLKLFNRMSVRIVNDHIMLAVKKRPSKLAMQPENAFIVESKDKCMYGKYLREVHFTSFSMDSDAVIRFRASDDKVAVADMLVGFGMYARSSDAVAFLLKLIKKKDDKVTDLGSMEIDETMFAYQGRHIIFMNFKDLTNFFNRIGVRAVNDALTALFLLESVYGSVDGVGDDIETHVVKSMYTIKIKQPSDRHTIRIEFIVRDEIDAFFSGFIHNKVLKGGDVSHRKKIDHRLRIGNTILAIETDEHAHVRYKQENERYQDFMRTFSYKFVFIRFNPHANMEDPRAKTDFKYKLHVLMDYIRTHIERIKKGQNVWKLEIVRLFYGGGVQFYAISQ